MGPSYDGYQGMQNGAIHAMAWLERDTIMTENQSDPCTSGDDSRFVREYLGVGTLGQYSCTATGGGTNVCVASILTISRQEIIRLSTTEVEWSDGENETNQIQRVVDKTSCHEMGHSVGLTHHPVPPLSSSMDRFVYYDGSNAERQQDCMVSGWIEGEQDWLRINSHDAAHIANRF